VVGRFIKQDKVGKGRRKGKNLTGNLRVGEGETSLRRGGQVGATGVSFPLNGKKKNRLKLHEGNSATTVKPAPKKRKRGLSSRRAGTSSVTGVRP